MIKTKAMKSAVALICGILFAVPSAQAGDAFAGDDSISPSFGNAARANRVMHTIDPWPEHAKKKHSKTSGKRVLNVMRDYEKRSITQTPDEKIDKKMSDLDKSSDMNNSITQD